MICSRCRSERGVCVTKWCICSVAILAIAVGWTATEGRGDSIDSNKVVLSKCVDALGFGRLADWAPSTDADTISVVTVSDSATPFLELDGRRAYRVALHDVPITYEKRFGDRVAAVEARRSFEVYVDSTRRTILRVESVLPSYYQKLSRGEIRIPDRVSAEEQLRAAKEEYSPLPDSFEPKVDFLAALAVLPGYPLDADRIVAICTIYSNMGSARPAWIVDTYGTRFPSLHHAKLEPYQENHIRSVVDATTGKWLFSLATPSVELESEDSLGVKESRYPINPEMGFPLDSTKH